MNVNFSNNQAIDLQELTRLKESLKDDGYEHILDNMLASYGLFSLDSNPTNGKLQIGSNAGTFKISATVGIDNQSRLIRYPETDNIAIASSSQWYWVFLQHSFRTTETGTVSIDAAGNLTGVGTAFTEVLRGSTLSETPVRVYFPDSVSNQLYYEVVEVISDTQAILSGTFQVENTINYSVAGSFARGTIIDASNRVTYQYDEGTITLLAGSGDPSENVIYDPNTTIYLGRVFKDTSNAVTVEDKRYQFARFQGEADTDTLTTESLLGIGVEGIKYMGLGTSRLRNEVIMGWGFRSTSYVVNGTNLTISILAGAGGKYRSNSDTFSGAFSGWFAYNTESKKRHKIISSTREAGANPQITLNLDTLDASDFATNPQLILVPPFDRIQFYCSTGAISPVRPDEGANGHLFEFDATTPYGSLYLDVAAETTSYNIVYRLLNQNAKGPWQQLPGGQYYDEDSYNDDGSLKDVLDRTDVTYSSSTSPNIILQRNPLALTVKTSDSLNTTTVINLSNTTTYYKWTVGASSKYVQLNTSFSLTLQQNIYIELDSLNSAGDAVKAGEEFWVQVSRNINITLNGFSVVFVQGFTDVNNVGTVHYTMVEDDFSLSDGNDRGTNLRFHWNPSNWVLSRFKSPPASNASSILTPTTWETLSLLSGSTEATGNFYPVSYVKDAMGFVHLRGRVIFGTVSGSGDWYELVQVPDGFNTAKTLRFWIRGTLVELNAGNGIIRADSSFPQDGAVRQIDLENIPPFLADS